MKEVGRRGDLILMGAETEEEKEYFGEKNLFNQYIPTAQTVVYARLLQMEGCKTTKKMEKTIRKRIAYKGNGSVLASK